MLRLLGLAALVGLATPALAQPAAPDSLPVRSVSDSWFSSERLLVPVEGVLPADLADTFAAHRSGGRTHEAIDILATLGTPVLAVADGEVVRVHTNRLGGNVLYLRSPDGAYDFYYAHLDAYESGIEEGVTVRQGEVLGYVGNTGNARDTAPHLHFQVLRLDGKGRGTPVNPYRLFQQSGLYPSRGVRG